MYHYLEQHPDIYLPPIKETNHFAAADIDHAHFLPTYARDVDIDLDAYIRSGMKRQVHIAHVDDPAHYAALFTRVKGEKAVGEISNSYMICPSAAGAIHAYAPDAKIIVVLRNPVRRAWSQYLMNLREAKSDDIAFKDELLRDHHAERKGWGVNHQYLQLGCYADQLKAYIDLFGKQNVLPIFFEPYRSDPQKVMREICTFLGVDSDFAFDFSVESNKASMPRNKTLNKLLVSSGLLNGVKNLTPKPIRKHFAKVLYSENKIPKLSAADREWLQEWYRAEVKKLADLLGDEVYTHWPEFKTTIPA